MQNNWTSQKNCQNNISSSLVTSCQVESFIQSDENISLNSRLDSNIDFFSLFNHFIISFDFKP